MKKLLVAVTLLALSSVSVAGTISGNGEGRLSFGTIGKVAVYGEKAEAIYEALETEVVTSDAQNFTLDTKRVNRLACVKVIKKAETEVVKYRCAMVGKKTITLNGNVSGNVSSEQAEINAKLELLIDLGLK